MQRSIDSAAWRPRWVPLATLLGLVLGGAYHEQLEAQALDCNGNGVLDARDLLPTLRFSPAENRPAGLNPWGVTNADLDENGDLDLAVANQGSHDVSVLLNAGGGLFARQARYPTGPEASGLVAGDLDGDGDLDLAASNGSPGASVGSVSILWNQGDGAFVRGATYPVGAHPYSLALGDLDADGSLDLITRNFASGDVSVLLGSDDGAFSPDVRYAVGPTPGSVAVGDLDGDRDLDLAVGSQDGAFVALLLNDALGRLTSGGSLPTQETTMSVTLGDWDGDGDLDLAASNRVPSSLSVFRNETEPPRSRDEDRDGIPDECEPPPFLRGDVNADGELDISDAVATLLGLFAGVPISCEDATDADDDGRLTIADPIGLLTHLFLRGLPPAPPSAACGPDRTEDTLGCDGETACGGPLVHG